MKLIDTHTHCWDLDNKINHWVTEQVDIPYLNTNYLPDNLVQKCNHELYGVVHVEAHDSAISTIIEIQWLDKVMNNHALKCRYISCVDITLPLAQFARVINEIKEYTNVVGVRHILAHNPKFKYNPCASDLSYNANIADNLSYLAQNKLIFDCQMYPGQINTILPAIIQSGVVTIIDHLALPAWQTNGDQDHQLWQEVIGKLVELNNVFIKVSGLDMFQPESNFNIVVQYCFDNFPIARLMYGSNYPVSFNHNYNYWCDYLNQCNLSTDEKEQLFFKNALDLFFKAQKLQFNFLGTKRR